MPPRSCPGRAAKAAQQVVEPAEALDWLFKLPMPWAKAEDSGRRLLTEALFEKVEVLGLNVVEIHPTPEADAHGWSDAFGPDPLLLDIGAEIGTYGRGERDRASLTHRRPPLTMINRTPGDSHRARARSA